MHINVNRQKFLSAMRVVEKSIKENKIRPILSCIYAKVKDNTLFLCGTNLETTIKTSIEIDKVITAGEIAFQFNLIDEYLRELKDDVVTLRLENENMLFIETSSSVSEFSVFSTENYPNSFERINFNEDLFKFEISSTKLIEIFEKIIFSVDGTDNIAINCVRIESALKHLHFISTDTYRLTYLTHNISKDIDNFAVSVPADTVHSLIKIFKGLEDDSIRVYQDDAHIYFNYKDTTIISKLIELKFPNYQNILINNQYDKKLIIENYKLTNLLKRVFIFSRSNIESKYSATFSFTENKLGILGINDIAKINEEMDVNYTGDNLKISLNVKYILDFLQNLSRDKKVELEFMHSNSAVKICEEDNENYTYILMPLALRD